MKCEDCKNYEPKKECEKEEHDWIFEKDWRKRIEFDNDTLKIPIVCNDCDRKADEIWMYAVVQDKKGEIIQEK